MTTLLSIQCAPARRVQMEARTILTAIYKMPVAGAVSAIRYRPCLAGRRVRGVRVSTGSAVIQRRNCSCNLSKAR